MNFVWVALSTVLFQSCQWLMFATLARDAGSSAVGRFAFALAVTSPPIIFANLNLRIVIATDVRSTFTFRDYLMLRVWCLSFCLAGVIGVAAVACDSGYDATLIAAVTLAKVFDSISDIIYGLLQKYEMMGRVALSRSAQGICQFLALFVTLRFSDDLLLVTVAWAAMSAVVTVSYDIRSVAVVRRRYPQELQSSDGAASLRAARKLFRISLPLAGTAVLGSIIGNLPVYALKHWRSVREVGVYSAQQRFITVIGLTFAALVQVVMPRLAHQFNESRDRFRGLLVKLIIAALLNAGVGLAFGLVAGEALLRLIYGPEYTDVALFTILVAAMGVALLSVVLGMAATAARIFKIQFWAGIAQLAVTVVVLVLLTPKIGLKGAATASLAGVVAYTGLMVPALLRSVAAAGQKPPLSENPAIEVPAQRAFGSQLPDEPPRRNLRPTLVVQPRSRRHGRHRYRRR